MKEPYLTPDNIVQVTQVIFHELTRRNFRPKPWGLNPDKAALLVLDMQDYFLDPASHAFTPSAPAIVPNIEKLIRFAILNKMPVVFTRHINQAGTAGNMATWWKDMITEENPLSGIIKPLINYMDNDAGAKVKLYVKSQYDAFYQTGLDHFLQTENIRQVVISGVLTNLCCETTARNAFVRGYEVLFPLDATAAYNLEFHLSTFRNTGFGFSPVITTDDLLLKGGSLE